eukprot:8281794-Pyramimonas_sp.AAC.1
MKRTASDIRGRMVESLPGSPTHTTWSAWARAGCVCGCMFFQRSVLVSPSAVAPHACVQSTWSPFALHVYLV